MAKAKKVETHEVFEKAEEAASEKRTRTSPNFPADAAVEFLVEANPKREGSKSHARWEDYAGTTTVGDYIAAGGTYGDLKYDAEHGFIKVEGFEAKLVERKVREPKAAKEPKAESAPAPVKRKGKKEKAAPATVEAEEEEME